MPEPGNAGGVVVFAGPSLPRRPGPRWRELLSGCTLRPPAKRGDVLAALMEGPGTVVLLDGYYYTVPSVSHKELLYALDAGVRVIGAASLGALRAVELEPQGMTGVGRIFEAYRRGEIDGDDEVALLHAPEENGYRPLTVALIEVRHALETLQGLPADRAGLLIDRLKEMAFTERGSKTVSGLAREILGADAGRALDEALSAFSLKEEDAREALELALQPAVPVPSRCRRITGYMTHFKESYLRLPSGPTLLHAWNVAQILHPEAAGFVRHVRHRCLLSAAAGLQGLTASEDRQRQIAAGLRGWHERLLGRACLPGPEYAEEAAVQTLAERAEEHSEALAGLARSLSLHPGPEAEACLYALAGQSDVLPAWSFVRAFTFTEAFVPSLEVAALAEQAGRRFRDSGRRFTPEDLQSLAVRLWRCEPSQVADEGRKRGLFPSHTLSDGLQDALELLAPLEILAEGPGCLEKKCEAVLRSSLGCPPRLSIRVR